MDWSGIYQETFPDLVRFFHRKVWDTERARDLAQEVFVRALSEEPERPRAFLFTVAANLARDEARTVLRRRRHLTLLKGEASGRIAKDDPQRDMEEKEQWERVRSALESLAERDQEVLLLWEAGMNYSEISDETGLAVSAIGTTLARARKRLVAAYEIAEREGHVARQ